MEQEVRDTACDVAGSIMEALRYIGDASYAILPRELAHDLGDFKKSLLSCIRNVVDKEIEWVDERVAGGDKLREEWQQHCHREEPPTAESAV